MNHYLKVSILVAVLTAVCGTLSGCSTQSPADAEALAKAQALLVATEQGIDSDIARLQTLHDELESVKGVTNANVVQDAVEGVRERGKSYHTTFHHALPQSLTSLAVINVKKPPQGITKPWKES